MLVKILEKVTLTVEPGSIVEISEGQFKALGDKAETYKVEAKEIVPMEKPKAEPKAKPKAPKGTSSKKTSTKKK